jgi:hypothetical protein
MHQRKLVHINKLDQMRNQHILEEEKLQQMSAKKKLTYIRKIAQGSTRKYQKEYIENKNKNKNKNENENENDENEYRQNLT